MKYLCLIYEAEAIKAQRTQEDMEQYIADYQTFTNDIVTDKSFVAGDALLGTETATSVRVRNGEVLTTDGPFAETKEQLGGYYLVDAKNLDHAIDIASRMPTSKTGTIEVRPIMVWEK